MIRRRSLFAAAAVLALATLPATVAAQGKSKGRGQGDMPTMPGTNAGPTRAKTPPGHAKKKVTHDHAVSVSREVLVSQGYSVARVERVGDTQVIYYYRGNNGRGRGRGPLERIVVRPSRERYVLDGAPKSVVTAVMSRLGF